MNMTMGKIQNGRALPYNFHISDVLKEAWVRVSGLKKIYWLAFGIIFFSAFVIGFIDGFSGALLKLAGYHFTSKVIDFVSQILVNCMILPIVLGISYVCVRKSVDLTINIKQVFSPFRMFWRIMGLYLITVIGVFIIIMGLSIGTSVLLHLIYPNLTKTSFIIIFLTLPGITLAYFAFSIMFAGLLLVEKKMGIFRALATSFLAFNQHPLKITFTILLMILLIAISILPLGIGLIWTLPMSANLRGILYRIAFGVEERRLSPIL